MFLNPEYFFSFSFFRTQCLYISNTIVHYYFFFGGGRAMVRRRNSRNLNSCENMPNFMHMVSWLLCSFLFFYFDLRMRGGWAGRGWFEVRSEAGAWWRKSDRIPHDRCIWVGRNADEWKFLILNCDLCNDYDLCCISLSLSHAHKHT